jgi:hypothetical protein
MLVARAFGFRQAEFFDASDAAQATPAVML